MIETFFSSIRARVYFKKTREFRNKKPLYFEHDGSSAQLVETLDTGRANLYELYVYTRVCVRSPELIIPNCMAFIGFLQRQPGVWRIHAPGGFRKQPSAWRTNLPGHLGPRLFHHSPRISRTFFTCGSTGMIRKFIWFEFKYITISCVSSFGKNTDRIPSILVLLLLLLLLLCLNLFWFMFAFRNCIFRNLNDVLCLFNVNTLQYDNWSIC